MNILPRLWRFFCKFAARQVTQHRGRSIVVGAILITLSGVVTCMHMSFPCRHFTYKETVIAANIANHLDSTPAPLDDLFAATFRCYPSFLHHPDPYLVLGIPSPPIFDHGACRGNAADIGDYIYDDPKLLKSARRQLSKCWHSDKARLHKGLSTKDLKLLNRNDGIFEDALNRALQLAHEGRGKYPTFIVTIRENGTTYEEMYLEAFARESWLWTTSKLALGSMDLTFLNEATKQDPILAQQLSNSSVPYAFKQAKDCPPCTPDFLLRELIEAALTPVFYLPAQAAAWRHIPETCAPCTWATIHRDYRYFFGDWQIDWKTLSLELTGLEQASRDGRLPPPGRTHEFWWRKDLDPPKLDSRGNAPSQRRIVFDLFCKYLRVTASVIVRKTLGITMTKDRSNPYEDENVAVAYDLWQMRRVPFGDGKEYPQVIHLFTEQLARYGRNTTVWRDQSTKHFFVCRDECLAARELWDRENRA
ncbi:hypothetical protein SVAN01_09368 [Stagonosporopsis vannaccii]|nr:hypothetical protein SVAN01_09368 [Stagonosporopsis vannaccii]